MASRSSPSDSFGTFLETLRRGTGSQQGEDFSRSLESLQYSLNNTRSTSMLIQILRFLAQTESPASPTEIIRNTKVDPSTALSLLRDAAGTGLLTANDLPDGGKDFSITPAGRQMLTIEEF
jgi:predicted transcriptional regulator